MQVDIRSPNNPSTDIYLEPSMDAAKLGAAIVSGQVFDVTDQHQDPVGNEFLELADGRGWVIKQYGAKQISFQWPRKAFPYICDPEDGQALPVLAAPRPDALRLGVSVQPGEEFLARDSSIGPDGVEYLKLTAHDGWVAGERVNGRWRFLLAKPLHLREWRYDPPSDDQGTARPFDLLKRPELESSLTGEQIFPGQRFLVIEEVEGDDLILFLRPVGKAGWIADRSGGGQAVGLCSLVAAEMWRYEPEAGGGEGEKRRRPFELLAEPRLSSALQGEHVDVGSAFYVEETRY